MWKCRARESTLASAALLETRFSPRQIVLVTIRHFFATALTCEGTTEGETSHSLLTWRTAKLSLIDGNLSRLVLGAITKPKNVPGQYRTMQ